MKTLQLIRKRDNKTFEVTKEYNGWKIIEVGSYTRSDAVLADAVLMWNGIEPFDSMIKAYKFLKENIDNLL